jgi:tRNA (adenine22-N1)-methyltransferase
MNTNKLSERLAAVAGHIPENSRIADIGSDHAYLPCHVVKRGAVSFAIAGEVAEGPFQSALKQVRSEGLSDRIVVRKGDGLDVVQPGEVDCITIAGMGGPLIASILERGKNRLEGTTNLVLQPNIGASAIRKWLLANGWKLVSETILKEDGKIYEILAAERGVPEEPYSSSMETEVLFGPYLLREKNAAFREKWTLEKQNWQKILEQLEQAGQSEATLLKRREIEEKIRMAEEVLS